MPSLMIKKVKIGTGHNPPYVGAVDGLLYVPVSGYTLAEIRDNWDDIPEPLNDSWYQYLKDVGMIGGGAIWFNPGFYNSVITNNKIENAQGYEQMLQVGYNCTFNTAFNVISNDYARFVDDNGDGFYFRIGTAGTGPGLYINGENTISSFTVNRRCAFGIYTELDYTPWASLCFIGITSDGYVVKYDINMAGKSASISHFHYASLEDSAKIIAWLQSLPDAPESEDPYKPGGYSSSGTGSSGTFSRPGDAVDFPSMPSLSAVDANLITLYNPSLSDIRALGSYLWSNNITDIFNKLFADPMDAILGLSIVPCSVPHAGNRQVYVGNVGTGVSMPVVTSQYVEIDCGSLNISEFFGSYLDYSPHTKIEIYLPYIGVRALDANECMGKTIAVKYHVDILSGACCAYIKCGTSVLYHFIGQCSASIPINSQDFTSVINGILGIAGAIGTTVATGGASAPMAVSTLASTAINGGLTPNIEKSGSVSGMGGFFGIQYPYLIITAPKQCLPERQNSFLGYPSFVTTTLETLSGFTQIEEIHLENVPATNDELDEIYRLLKEGVLL